MNKLKKNEIIAEFIGMQKTAIGWYDYNEILNLGTDNTFDELKFHSSWDWLIPIIKFINDNYTTDSEPKMKKLNKALLNCDIKLCYKLVFKVIDNNEIEEIDLQNLDI